MYEENPTQETATKTVTLPLFCNEGHQIYIVWFPQLDCFGFACAMCHVLGTSITHGERVLEVLDVTAKASTGFTKADLLLGMGTRVVHQQCTKHHNLMAFEFTEGFGVGCIHCKLYSLTFGDKGRTFEIRVTRKLDPKDPKVKALPTRAVTEDPTFTIH
jgi:hypothetical protein